MSVTRHVVLVGLPGCGKSTVAPRLAALLGWRSADTDSLVEERSGTSISRLFAEHGEARFREAERRVLEECLRSAAPLVIAAGGGLVAQPGALELLRPHATIVFLDAGHDLLLGRVGAHDGSRPLLAPSPGAALHHLRSARAAAHAQAELRVRVDGLTPEEVAARVATALTGAIHVGTATPYLIRVGSGVLDRPGEHIPPHARRVAVIADEAVAPVAHTVAASLRDDHLAATVIALPGGEQAKRWTVAGNLLERCSDLGLERDDCLVAVGGGSIGDVAGLVAATYLRGIAWVVVPTTLLAMVDSAVGGKTAVNLRRGKNLAGVFWQPRAVLCDPAVLGSLDKRSFRSAFAEIVKSSMVGASGLAELVDRRIAAGLAHDPAAIGELVRGCCALKASVVAADERESGRRAILNYGHTVGHAVEALTGLDGGLDHGESVAFGMRVAGRLSVLEAGCPAPVIAHQDELLEACGLSHRPQLPAAQIAAQLGTDKKARGGVPRWVLLRDRGEAVTGIVIEREAINDALEETMAA